MLFLFGSQRPSFPFSFDGGVEKSIYTLIEGVVQFGIDVIQICTLPTSGFNAELQIICSNNFFEVVYGTSKYDLLNFSVSLETKEDWIFLKRNHFLIIAVSRPDYFQLAQQLFIKLSPDLLITYLNGSEELIELAGSNGTPTIHRVFGVEDMNFPKLSVNTVVLANSPLSAQVSKEIYGCSIPHIYSPINFNSCRTQRKDPRYVTFINPREEKGIFLFCDFVKLLPQIPFLVVQGWGQCLYENTEKQAFEFLKSLPNVNIISSVLDINEVYRKTKILVVPSKWAESFGRVVLEAQINGIPIIASRRGNLPLTVGEGGFILPYGKPKLWAKAISKLYFDEDLQHDCTIKANMNVTRFDHEILINKFYHFFISTINGNPEQNVDENNEVVLFQNIVEISNEMIEIEKEKWENKNFRKFVEPIGF